MAESAQAAPTASGFTRRFFEAFGAPVWAVGIGLALFALLLLALQELVLGRTGLLARDADLIDDLLGAATHVVIVAYLLTAYVYAQRTTERSITKLLPLIDSHRVDELLAHSAGERTAYAVAGVLSIPAFVAVNLMISPGEPSLWPSTWGPETSWHRVLGLLMSVFTFRLFTLLALESGRLSALAGAIRHVDLLEQDALAPFTRQGLTYALLVIGVTSVYALFLVDLAYLPLLGLIVVPTVVVAAVALLLPLRGIRARIVAAKHVELAWCREQMRARRAGLAEGDPADDGAGLAELVAWEARIEAVREWPIDMSTFTRFALLLLLPVGSWAGGALVERAIDALLD